MCLFMCRRREKIMEGITMLDPKKVRLGICPIGWSNDDMWDLGDENTFQQCISEMKLAGFDGCEVGHKYPEDKTVLKHMLDVRNMTIASKWFSSFLVDKPYEEVEAEFVKELEYLSYVGATAINVSEQSGSIQGQLDTPVLDDKKRVLTDEEWDRFTTGLNKLGKIAADRGFKLCFHHHILLLPLLPDRLPLIIQSLSFSFPFSFHTNMGCSDDASVQHRPSFVNSLYHFCIYLLCIIYLFYMS